MNQREQLLRTFGEKGPLASAVGPAYRVRPGQVDLAEACLAAIDCESSLIAEGPTGIGKSFAYSVPLVIRLREGAIKQAIISTANIALQSQLVGKDLPFLRSALGEFTFALLKGRSNYLCRQKLSKLHGRRGQLSEELTRVLFWARGTSTGDKEELEFPCTEWGRVSTTGQECPGGHCPFSSECFATLARNGALSAQIIVTNYHLLLSGAKLPEHQVLVCDEAHELADVARSALGWELTLNSFNQALTFMAEESPGMAAKTAEEARRFFGELEYLMRRENTLRVRSWEKDTGVPHGPLVRAVGNCSEHLEERLEDYLEGEGRPPPDLVRGAKLFTGLYGRLLGLGEELEAGNHVCWVSRVRGARKTWVQVNSSPIVVSGILPAVLFGRARTSILLSATMRAGGTFDYVREEVGLAGVDELAVGSPFRLDRQGAIVIPQNILPPPRNGQSDSGYLKGVADTAERLIRLCGGRCLLLFTSWKSLNYVWKRLEHLEIGKQLGIRICKQGDAPRMKLVEQFAADETSVLLGVASLWQGIDVPGNALIGLMIDKIPFPVPDEPLIEAMGERVEADGGSSFFNMSVPRATLALKQGIGRLIRSETDRGVVVITDRRLTETGYGKVIMRSLPGLKRVISFRQAASVFRQEKRGKENV